MKHVITFYLLFVCLITGLSAQNARDSAPFSQAKFVPDISLILDMSFLYRDMTNPRYQKYSIPAFTEFTPDQPIEDESPSHSIESSPRGFNLNYCEMSLYSVVDPYFDLFAVFHLSEHGIDLEEGYLTTRNFPHGLQAKAGKFLSHFGRINEQHEHYWDFSDIPLVYGSFFGGNLNEKGMRLSWVAPADFYFMLGGEILKGEDGSSFGSSGFGDAGGSVVVPEKDFPGISVSYVKSSFDVGDLTLLASLSGAFGTFRLHSGLDRSDDDGFAVDADAHVLGGALTLKYMMDSNRDITLQTEALYRTVDGTHYQTHAAAVSRNALTKRQSGLYCQLVHKGSRRWRMGIRLDYLDRNHFDLGGETAPLPRGLSRYSGMIECNPTEFSRIRVQANLDRSRFIKSEGLFRNKSVFEAMLQINLAIGAHGAHAF
ncbi:hypothetical protein JW906_09035 [bacterium]|nr:hypothetical protein [bacterium]